MPAVPRRALPPFRRKERGDVLSDPTPDGTLPLPLARRVDEVCSRFDAAWKLAADGAEPPRLEDYLAGESGAAREALLRELLLVESHHRRRTGERPRPEDYRGRLPEQDLPVLAAVLAPGEPAPLPGAATVRRSPMSLLGTPSPGRDQTQSEAEPTRLFLEALRQSGLLDGYQVEAAVAQAGVARLPEDLSDWLIGRGWLTAYQARRLLIGRPDGLVLGGYHLLEPLGQGGMGQVFKARHALMNRVVAVKFIHPDLVNDPEAARRFRQEIRAAAQLSHPNVVLAHDAEQSGGRHFLVMEYCEGVNLRRLVDQSGPLPAAAACEYVRQAALGLQHAFERGLTHRDLKPDNLMLVGGTVQILDFGLARLRESESGSSSVTKEGLIVGTPDFMAPEQAVGRADVRSDLYSLGCTLYYLLTAQAPFPGGSTMEKCMRHRCEEPEPLGLRRPDVPEPLQQLIRRLMAKAPAQRFQTPAELAEALAPFAGGVAASPPSSIKQAGDTPPSPTLLGQPRRTTGRSRLRVAVGLGAALAAALVGLGVYVATRDGRDRRPTDPVEQLRTVWTWRKSRALPIPQGQATASAYGLAFSPDSRLLAVACGNNQDSGPKLPGRLLVWQVSDWRQALDREVKSGPATSVAFSPDGKRLACGSGSWSHDAPGHVTLLGVSEWDVKAHFEAHPKGVMALAFQPKGGLLVTSGREGKVRFWDGEWGAHRGDVEERTAPVLALAFSADGERLAVGCDGGSVKLWRTGTRQALGTLEPAPGKPVRGLAFSQDGQTILAVTKRGQEATADLLAWRGPDRRAAPAVRLGATEAYFLAISPDRSAFLAGCLNNTAMLYRTETREQTQTLSGDHPFFCAAFSPDGRYLATSGGWFGPVQLWEPAD
jgi:serine/threonine protein kinase